MNILTEKSTFYDRRPEYEASRTAGAVPLLPELRIVEDQLQSTVSRAEGIIRESCLRLLSSGGKRLRPLLTLQSALCFGPLNTATLQAAVAAELIHMASLIHDDVIDHSDQRRGQPTINSQLGNHAAVLTGDYLFAEAFHILSSPQLLESMKFLIEAIQAMCNGEVEQANQQLDLSLTVHAYFERIAQKTGILLASSCRSGAATAGASAGDIDRLGSFGMYLGYAYQIIDDLLDFTGNAKQIGKPVGSDLLNGNLTLPMLYLLQNPLYGSWARDLLRTKPTPQILPSIIQALIASEALDETLATALTCVRTALSFLEKIPSTPAKSFLTQLAYTVVYRQQ